MSAIHEAARTVEQAAQVEEAKLTAILDEAEDIQHQINATEERLRNLRGRLVTVTEDLTAQRLANEQAGKLAEVVRHLEIKAAPAPMDVPTPEYERALASHAAAPDRTHAFPVLQQGTSGSPLQTTVLPPHGLCTCGTPGLDYEGPQRDCPVHGEQQDGGADRG